MKKSKKSSFKLLDAKQKLACITLDFEEDYSRTKESRILKRRDELSSLSCLFSSLKTPLSTFVTTEMLINYPEATELVNNMSNDLHCHSHTHNMENFDSEYEISTTKSTFEKYFGYSPKGYRAPRGVLYENDIEILKKYNFKFSASIFPSYRPGVFNNLSYPTTPFLYDNGIMELPFSVVSPMGLIFSQSYIKFLGFNLYKSLVSIFRLQDIVIFDSHLHDFIIDDDSFDNLPSKYKLFYRRNKRYGRQIFIKVVNLLKKENYNFVTMSDLYEHLRHNIK